MDSSWFPFILFFFIYKVFTLLIILHWGTEENVDKACDRYIFCQAFPTMEIVNSFKWYLTLIKRRRQWHPTPALLPGKSHGRRSLAGCSPWDCSESDMTERLHFHFSLACIGEGNGNPLQCSCLENPMDRGAWWAAVYGVAQSRTRLK